MKTKETSPKQIYITVVTSGLTMLANKVARVLQPNEDIFDACSELAKEIADENKLHWSNVLVHYFNHYSDTTPAMALKVPYIKTHQSTKETSKVICSECNQPKNGVETGLCNHCGKFGKNPREQAMSWWSNLSDISIQMPSKSHLCKKYHGDMRIHKSLTGREIEEIWLKETNQIDYQISDTEFVLKPNQKQFQQFDEILFKSYIDKFNKNDKFKALKILWEDLNVTKELNEALK